MKSVDAWFKKLEASEQEELMMQFQSKAEGLEIPWRVAGANQHLKAKQSGF